jgi:hypothetical protein
MSDIPANPYAPPVSDPARPGLLGGLSWRAILAGAVVAATVGAMLNLLGLALGAAAVNPFDMSRGDAEGFSIGAGFWTAIANAIALFVGAFVATRAARGSDGHRGMLTGLSVWAVAFLLALLIAASQAGMGLNSVLNGAAERGDVARTTDLLSSPGAVPEGAEDLPAVAPSARAEVDRAADTTSAIALWGFLTMAAGAIAAILGARYGERRHGWEARAMAPGGHRDRRHERERERDRERREDARMHDTRYPVRPDENGVFDRPVDGPDGGRPLM